MSPRDNDIFCRVETRSRLPRRRSSHLGRRVFAIGDNALESKIHRSWRCLTAHLLDGFSPKKNLASRKLILRKGLVRDDDFCRYCYITVLQSQKLEFDVLDLFTIVLNVRLEQEVQGDLVFDGYRNRSKLGETAPKRDWTRLRTCRFSSSSVAIDGLCFHGDLCPSNQSRL